MADRLALALEAMTGIHRQRGTQHKSQSTLRVGETHQDNPDQSISTGESLAAWAELLAKAYKVDPSGGSCLLRKQQEFHGLHKVQRGHARSRRHYRPSR